MQCDTQSQSQMTITQKEIPLNRIMGFYSSEVREVIKWRRRGSVLIIAN